MIDFTNCPRRHKTYAGANGSKISIIYDNHLYMLKFPSDAPFNKDMSYANSCISEYIGCHIFKILGFNAQETLLGKYTINDTKEKLVVACKDFTYNGETLQDFASLKNQIIDSVNNGYGTELNDILNTIEHQISFDSLKLMQYFWAMFIVDTLIGNWDRHNGNWGFLYDIKNDTIRLAPIFDCGSSLYPQANETVMKNVLTDENELKARIYQKPTSAIEFNRKRILYFDFCMQCTNSDFLNILKKFVPIIYEKLPEIQQFIYNIEILTDLQKEFYTSILLERYKRILKPAYDNHKQINTMNLF